MEMKNMNVALIFAGGCGVRMNNNTIPKQFLKLHGKEIIIYTLEIFQKHNCIDGMVVVCIKEWIDTLKELVYKYNLNKVLGIVEGGKNTQESQFLGLKYMENLECIKDDSIVLIHDGVRPLVDELTITRNIDMVKKAGSAITVTDAIETIVYSDNDHKINEVVDRKKCKMAKAPQSYYFRDIYNMHKRAIKDGKLDFIDSACMMNYYGVNLQVVEGNDENIKITTPTDYYLFKAIEDAKENFQIWG